MGASGYSGMSDCLGVSRDSSGIRVPNGCHCNEMRIVPIKQVVGEPFQKRIWTNLQRDSRIPKPRSLQGSTSG
jgi:hypothetical protein